MACWACGAQAAHATCHGCGQAKYCGRFCQRRDWSRHKPHCGRSASVPRFELGDHVLTQVALDSDVQGKDVPAGTRAVIHELPATNGGLYSIAVGFDVYDVQLHEIRHVEPTGATRTKSETPGAASTTPTAPPVTVAPPLVGEDGSGVRFGSHDGEVLWSRGVRAWYTALREGDLGGLRSAMDSFREALEAFAVPPAPHDRTPSTRERRAATAALASRLVFVAAILMDAEDHYAARDLLRRALEVDPENEEAYLELCLSLEEAGLVHEAREVARAAVTRGVLWGSELQRPGTLAIEAMPGRPFWSSQDFPWASALEAEAESVIHEARALLRGKALECPGEGTEDVSAERGGGGFAGLEGCAPDAVDVADLGGWDAVGGRHRSSGHHDGSALAAGDWREKVIFGFGEDEASNPAPATASLIARLVPEAVDLCRAGAGEVIFSALAPHSHIAPHCAPTNFRLTAHLGLIIPKDRTGCTIRVGQETRAWQPGRLLIFDDSFEHEIRNDTDEIRVILLIRFWHPALSTREQRKKSVEKAQARREAALRRRQFPPLGLGNRALELYISGEAPCTSCGAGSDRAVLDFEDKSGGWTAMRATCGLCQTTFESRRPAA